MNQGRIWCVVKPTVGLPLLLGSVTVIALAVHTAVLTSTTWFSGYWEGGAKGKTAQQGGAAPVAFVQPGASPGLAITMSPVASTPGKAETSFIITVTPTAVSGEPSLAASSASQVAAGPPADK